ncbi:hypothetical protein HDV00_000953 [Rhizophlyctis rosea]|nr:hypothetical protein HDV00_000953 [Rhizophlyctis rosea]
MQAEDVPPEYEILNMQLVGQGNDAVYGVTSLSFLKLVTNVNILQLEVSYFSVGRIYAIDIGTTGTGQKKIEILKLGYTGFRERAAFFRCMGSRLKSICLFEVTIEEGIASESLADALPAVEKVTFGRVRIGKPSKTRVNVPTGYVHTLLKMLVARPPPIALKEVILPDRTLRGTLFFKDFFVSPTLEHVDVHNHHTVVFARVADVIPLNTRPASHEKRLPRLIIRVDFADLKETYPHKPESTCAEEWAKARVDVEKKLRGKIGAFVRDLRIESPDQPTFVGPTIVY